MTILLEDITKAYNGRNVLEHKNISIEWGGCYGIVGEEGVGKTTLLKIFMGTEQPDGGGVHRMGDYKYPTLRSAYVSQEGRLNRKKNAIWNVHKAYRKIGKAQAAEQLQLLLTLEECKVAAGELSVAKQRWVEIVAACVVPADFFVLDDPFRGMSREERGRALTYILECRGSRPLLVATRDEEELDGIPQVKVYHL
jgi:ABC-type branched-subunit amino acid transport system ATPase component